MAQWRSDAPSRLRTMKQIRVTAGHRQIELASRGVDQRRRPNVILTTSPPLTGCQLPIESVDGPSFRHFCARAKFREKGDRKMGRPALPTSLKKLRGTLQPSRVHRGEPTPEIGATPRPAHLSKGASVFWDSMVQVLTEMRVLTTADATAVAALCETLADLAAARAALAKRVKSGSEVIAKAGARTYTTTSRTGAVMIRTRPEVGMIADADRRLMAWLSRFGLSPADRSRVSETTAPRDNPFLRHGAKRQSLDDFLAGDPDCPRGVAAARAPDGPRRRVQ